jgi:hypothetical protein
MEVTQFDLDIIYDFKALMEEGNLPVLSILYRYSKLNKLKNYL